MILEAMHRLLVRTLEVERRLEPFFRPALNHLLREPSAVLLQYLINNKNPGDTVVLTVLRGEEQVDLSVTLGKRP